MPNKEYNSVVERELHKDKEIIKRVEEKNDNTAMRKIDIVIITISHDRLRKEEIKSGA